MYDTLEQLRDRLSRKYDDALIRCAIALDRGDNEEYILAFAEVAACHALLESIKKYLNDEIMLHKDYLCLH